SQARNFESTFKSKDEHREVTALLAKSTATVDDFFLDVLSRAAVVVEGNPRTYEHRIYDRAFELTNEALKMSAGASPDIRKKIADIIQKRLNTETENDPRTRGKLYRSLGVLLPLESAGTLAAYRKSIV